MYQTSTTKGQELVAQRMVKEFRRQGYDAVLITSIYHDWEPVVSPEEAKKKGGYIHLFDRNLGIPVVRVNSEGASWPPRRVSFVDFMGVLSQLVEELDLNVLITHSTLWNGPEEVAKFIDWRRRLIEGGTPHHPVLFCHMSHLQEASEERYAIYERSYREAWNSSAMPQIFSVADVVLVTTPLEGQLMKNLGLDESKIFIFPGGVDDDSLLLSGDADQFMAKYKLPAQASLVTYLGTLEERKNPGAILAVARALQGRRDIHFVIAGRLEGDYGAKLKEEAAALRNVSVLGPVSEEDKGGLIRASRVNINMSRSEALGLSQLEFMLLGVPVITSGAGGQSWVVNGDRGVILRGPEDIDGAVAATTRLVDSPSLRRRIGKTASRFAAAFTLTRLVDGLAKKLERRLLARAESAGVRMSSGEQVIEAQVSNGQRVAATTKRLVITSAQGGKAAVIIPYNQIVKIVRWVRAPWSTLGAGLGVTVFLIGERILHLGLIDRLQPEILFVLSKDGHPELTLLTLTLLPLAPLTVTLIAFVARLSRGYLVRYGTEGKLFLPKEFLKALRLADKLTPKDLFAEGNE